MTTTNDITESHEGKIENRNSKIGTTHFSQLTVWQLSKDLCVYIYTVTKVFPREEQFGLCHQLRRAAISISSNIAEGYGRRQCADKAHFYQIAKGSTDEVECQLRISFELQMINTENVQIGIDHCNRIKKMLNALIRQTFANSAFHQLKKSQ